VLYLPNHGINSRVFCDYFSVILVFARACYLAILTLNQVLWLLVVEFYRITYSPPSRFSHFLNHDIPRIKYILLSSNTIGVAQNSLPIIVNVNLCVI
jgi:hypothetical protein